MQYTVAANSIRFVLLLLVALLVGTMVGIWVGFNPASLSASAYVEQQQNAIHALNVLMPATGAVSIVLTLVLALMAAGDPRTRYLLAAVAGLLVVAGLITRFGNQPINAIVASWSAQSPAANWAQLRDAWWYWHIWRSIAGVAALALLVLAVLGAKRPASVANVA
ncbi:MAG: DUF1772 domain-containing protein [Caldimonas sp.]